MVVYPSPVQHKEVNKTYFKQRTDNEKSKIQTQIQHPERR